MTRKENDEAAWLHPLLGVAAVAVLLAVTVVAPWLRHNAAMILLVFRSLVAVALVLAAYRIVVTAVRSAAEHRPVERQSPADWFEKYRPDEPQPEPRPEPEPVPAEPQAGLAPVIPIRRPAQAEPEVTR